MLRLKASGIASTVSLLMVAPLLSGCNLIDMLKALMGPTGERIVIVNDCPEPLGPMPAQVAAALEPVIDEPAVNNYVDSLDKQQQKLAAC